MFLNTFHAKQDYIFTKIYKLYYRITITAGSEWFNAINAMTVKNVPLKFLPICKEYVNVASRFGCKKNSLSFALHI